MSVKPEATRQRQEVILQHQDPARRRDATRRREPTSRQIREEGLWRAMGLRDEEYRQIVEILGREPNYTELGMYAVLWSEHCAYKHTRPLFKLFPTSGPRILQGPGENAGVVDIGDGQAVVFKVESHNHPSAVEPYQGAATGVGGIVRDIFTMGARPVAVLDSLRFGSLEDPRVRYLFSGVVSGISGYGNCLGLPTVGGEAYFDDCYAQNPLVNVMCVGLAKQDEIALASAKGVGNPVMVVGATTGRDGIHGATFASVELNERSEEKRPSVQVGDPFTEKLLIEACLEAIRSGAVVGIQDMGAAGLTSSASEMAGRAGSGIEMDIALVPRREEGMTPYEMMLSESQERMLVVPQKGREEELVAIFARWGLQAVVVGRVTDDGMLRVTENGEVVAEVPARSLTTDGAPVYRPEARRPAYLDELQAFDWRKLPEPEGTEGLGAALLTLLAASTIASKEWVYRQYDYMVQTNTVAGPGSDAAVLRVRRPENEKGRGNGKGPVKGIGLTIDSNGRYCYLDPFTGGQIAVAEAARNLVCTGAEPLAVTDGLNFGNPEKPEIYWQLTRAVEGIASACRELGTPVVGGNASLYNETNGEAIYPTPVIGMVGLLEDIERRCASAFGREGDRIVLLGPAGEELGGSEYLKQVHGIVAGRPPALDMGMEKRVQKLCLAAIRRGLLHSAHDCAEGGLAVALAESCIGGNTGATVRLPYRERADAALFGESQSRILVSVAPENLDELRKLAGEYGVPVLPLGEAGGAGLQIELARTEPEGQTGSGTIYLPLEAMVQNWRESIARHMKK